MPKPLGRLVRVDLRDAWASEATDFTPWLAQEENISILSEAIEIDLEVEAQEKDVGPFRADILCKDTLTKNWVLIENQLARTDHTHLGQLMTYAAGLHAATVVWIAQRFTDEHRAALDWLNEITDGRFNFFGLEIELWQIGDSPVAPKFNVICQPNDWTQTISRAANEIETGKLTPTRQLQLEYWTALWALLRQRSSTLKGSKPRPDHTTSFTIGRSEFWLEAFANTRDKRVGVLLECGGNHAKEYFALLSQDRAAIEAEIGDELDWQASEEWKQCRIRLRRSDFDPANRIEWGEQHSWLADKLEAFRSAFAPRVKRLDVAAVRTDDNRNSGMSG